MSIPIQIPAVACSPSLLIFAQLEAPKPNGTAHNPNPRLSRRKPPWIVKTESNVRKEKPKTPDPPCNTCHGRGRVHCPRCNGKGRTNHVDLAMLPKGEWPKWCKKCGGSGLCSCPGCLGTGEYSRRTGIDFLFKDAVDHTEHEPRSLSRDDLLSIVDYIRDYELDEDENH